MNVLFDVIQHQEINIKLESLSKTYQNIPCENLGCGKLIGRLLICDPRMIENILSRVAFSWIANKKMSDQVFCTFRNTFPLHFWKVIDSILNGGKKQLLTVLTCFTPLPATILTTLAIERWVATHHYVPEENEMK